MPNGTGLANQLTSGLVQLSQSTRGCPSTKVKGRSKEEWDGKETLEASRDEDKAAWCGFRHQISGLAHEVGAARATLHLRNASSLLDR